MSIKIFARVTYKTKQMMVITSISLWKAVYEVKKTLQEDKDQFLKIFSKTWMNEMELTPEGVKGPFFKNMRKRAASSAAILILLFGFACYWTS